MSLQLGMCKDRLRVPQVGAGDAGGGVGQQCPAVADHDWVVVHLHHPQLSATGDGLGDLVDVGLGRQARADVEELADPGLSGKNADRAAQERPVSSAMVRAWGTRARICSATAGSAGKLSLPPRK